MSWNQSTKGSLRAFGPVLPKGQAVPPLLTYLWWARLFWGLTQQTPGDVHEGAGVVSDVLTSRLLLPGRVGGERDQQAGYQLVLGWAAVDVTEQVYMEPPPTMSASQSSFSHYLVLSPRKSATKGARRDLLPDAQGMDMVGLGGSRTAAGREGMAHPTHSLSRKCRPLVGAADWDLAGLDSALSWPKVQEAGGLWVGEGGVKGWDPTQPHNPALHCSNPSKWDFSGVGQGPSSRPAVSQRKSERRLISGEEVKRFRG